MSKKIFVTVVMICLMMFSFCSCDKSTNTECKTVSVEENEEIPAQNTETIKYIGNKNSIKFHVPDCRFVSLMSESNKVFLNCTHDEAIADGFSPCEKCCP